MAGGVQIILDAKGRVYIAPYGGLGTTGKGLALTVGWLRRNTEPSAETLDSFISGLSGAGSLAIFGGQYSYTWGGPGSGYADEVGVAIPGVGGNLSWGAGPIQTMYGWR